MCRGYIIYMYLDTDDSEMLIVYYVLIGWFYKYYNLQEEYIILPRQTFTLHSVQS